MYSDKLKDLVPLTVSYFKGESPTAEKLEGMMAQLEDALEYVEFTIGDAYNRSEYSRTWLNNISRMLGDSDALSPFLEPSYEEDGYIQQLVLGKTDHELDLIPVGAGSSIISESNDTSVVISQYQNSVSELSAPGDWTIQSSIIEGGNQKNYKRLVTHSPSSGGSITFSKVTTGRGSAKELAKYNVIPTVAQAESGGPFVQVSLENSETNTYTFTLPEITKRHNSIGDIEDASVSNTSSYAPAGRTYTLPEYFFDANGLDLASDDSGIRPEKVFPANILQVYRWEDKQRIEGIKEIRASQVPSARKYQFSITFEPDVIINTDFNYMISVTGTSISDYLRNLSYQMINHKHAGDDMGRHIKHSDLIDLRTDSENYLDRSSYYGPSSIRNNDHSMYLHRNGFTDSDTGAGGNVMRGDLVIGNTDTGAAADHENFNLNQDSYSLYFGNRTDSPRAFFEKNAIHSTTLGRNNLDKDYSGSALKIVGPVNMSSGFKNTILEGALRVTTDTVLGSTPSDTVVVSGNMYVNKSATFAPVDPQTIPMEEGTVFYDAPQKELAIYNGSKKIAPGRTGIAVLVGDGINSWGKYNSSNDAAILQAALDDAAASGGGVVLLQEGVFNLGFNTLQVPGGVTLRGLGNKTKVLGQNTLISLDSTVDSGVENLVVGGDNSSKCQKGISISNSLKARIASIKYEFCQIALTIDSQSANCRVEADCAYTSVDAEVRAEQGGLINQTNTIGVYRPIGYIEKMSLEAWGSKESFARKWITDSGAATIQYDSSMSSSKGKGAFKINGLGTLVLDELLSVSPNVGIGGYVEISRLGTGGEVTIGATCYDEALNVLGDNGGFILNNHSLTSQPECYWGVQTTEGVDPNEFPSGTRFVRPYIQITSNSDGLYIDNFEIHPLTIARVSTFL